MEEKNLDFDKTIDRRNTNCLKFDFAVERGRDKDILPLWVADMDFQTSSLILDVLEQRVRHGIFGYTESKESYFESVAGWMKKKFDWTVKKESMIKTPGVVFALAMAVQAYTKEGDAVLVQQPVYYSFMDVIRDNNRSVLSSDLILSEDGKYYTDFEDFERKIVENNVKLFILCSPHNPVGKVWTKEELTRMGEICLKHSVVVVSDEIHEDFVYGEKKHTVFASISEDFDNIAVTCTSPAKTFNLAGLHIANIFISNTKLREKFKGRFAAAGFSQLNTMGIAASEAAYNVGETWYEAMLEYVKGNIDFVREYLKNEMPEIKLIEPEGTYLLWLDFRALGLRERELEELIGKRAKVWLDRGSAFGNAGAGFERINVACPRKTLAEALDRIKNAINSR